MIKLDKINKSYGGKKIFENFNLEIEEGKITAVLGESAPSSAAKSIWNVAGSDGSARRRAPAVSVNTLYSVK